MKKFLSAIIAAAMTVSCMTAQAASRTEEVFNSIYDDSEIHILYNDTVVKYDDVKPVNTDGRVMIPFRAALENMGAAVDYNNESRLVTAKKGDTEIKFTLMDDIIYINKNGEQSTITMDTPMIIVSDRTLVPIRFMSNALGMQVGWDGDTETVIILDYDAYSEAIKTAAPNFSKLSEIEQPANIKSSDSFEISFNTEGISEEKINLSLSGKAETVSVKDAQSSDFTIAFSGLGIDIKDAALKVMASDGKVYVKTDLIEKLAPQIKDEAVQNSLKMVSSDKWYTLDLIKFIDSLPMTAETKTALSTALTGVKTGDAASIITSMVKTDGDAELDSALLLTTFLDTFETIDKYISVTAKENGGYEVKMNITDEEYDKIILDAIGSELSDEDKKLVSDALNVTIGTSAVFDGSKGSGDMTADMKVDIEGIKLGLSIKLNDSFEKDDSLKAPAMPTDSVDITDMLINALK